MNLILLLAEAAGGDGQGQVQRIATTFGVDWPHLVAQIISFSIVCFLLQRYAYRPILAELAARRQRIADGLTNADKIRDELAHIEIERKEVLTKANAQGEKLIEEARAAAAHLREQESRKATVVAEGIVTKAHETATLDRDRLFTELKRDIGHLTVQTAKVVTGKFLTPEDQRRLEEEATRSIAA